MLTLKKSLKFMFLNNYIEKKKLHNCVFFSLVSRIFTGWNVLLVKPHISVSRLQSMLREFTSYVSSHGLFWVYFSYIEINCVLNCNTQFSFETFKWHASSEIWSYVVSASIFSIFPQNSFNIMVIANFIIYIYRFSLYHLHKKF